jgi:hypothetical protein
MTKLLSPREAASRIGVNLAQVKEWTRRSNDPLPNVVVGKSGKFRKVLVDEIPTWLAREAERERPQNGRR